MWLIQWMPLSAMDISFAAYRTMYIDQIDHKWCIVFFRSYFAQNHLEPYPHMCDIRFINGNNNKQHVSFHRCLHVHNGKEKIIQQTIVGCDDVKNQTVHSKLFFFPTTPRIFAPIQRELDDQIYMRMILYFIRSNVRDIHGTWIEWHIRKF